MIDRAVRGSLQHVLIAAALFSGAAARAVAQEAPPTGAAESPERESSDATSRQAPEPQGPELTVPVIGVGSQVVLLAPAPTLGTGAAAITLDLGDVSIDTNVGVFLAGELESSVRGNVRVFFPVHRGPIADFSLGVGMGLGYEEPTGGELKLLWDLVVGAKMRSFVGRNIALEAVLGCNVFFRDGSPSLGVGGRLLGSAGFMYFFR